MRGVQLGLHRRGSQRQLIHFIEKLGRARQNVLGDVLEALARHPGTLSGIVSTSHLSYQLVEEPDASSAGLRLRGLAQGFGAAYDRVVVARKLSAWDPLVPLVGILELLFNNYYLLFTPRERR